MENKWISVSERLPSTKECVDNNCIFIVSDGNRTYATHFDYYKNHAFGEPTMNGFRIDKCVIAWQTLPNPYEEV